MSNIKKVKFANMLPIIEEVLSSGSSTKLTVTGSSMLPFLREDIDSVELTQADMSSVKTGHIVLVRDNGSYVLHRILLKKKDCFYTTGDFRQNIEGPFFKEHLIAAVAGVWRGSRYIPCSNTIWRALSYVWLILFPIRYILIGMYNNLGNLRRKMKQ